MTIGKQMGLGFGVLLALVASLAVVVLLQMDGMHRQFSFVIQHDAPLIANARHLMTLVVDMETGQRGFIITGKDDFLEPYERARASIADLIKQEKQLISDNPPQVKLLEEIEASIQEWQETAAAPAIALRRKVSEAGVDAYHLQEILSLGVGKRLMDRVMALGHEIEVSFLESKDWEGAYAVEIIEKCMADREDGQRGFLITGQEEFLDKYLAGEQQKLPEYFARLRSLVSDRGRTDELSETIDRLEELTVQWSREAAIPEIAARRRMNEHPESLRDVAILLENGAGKKIFSHIRRAFSKFIEEEERLTAMRFTEASQAYSATKNTIILLALVSVFCGGGLATTITLGITKPVRRLASALGTVAKGDLSQEIVIKSEDEIGELSKSFNQMVGDLKRLEEDREQGEQALRTAKDYADNIIRSMIDMLVVVAPDGSIVTANQAACRLLGYQEEELVGQPASLLFHEEKRARTSQDIHTQEALPLKRTVLHRLESDGSISNIEESFLCRSGDSIPVLMSGSVMHDNEGQARGVVCVAQDVTERNRMMGQLQQLAYHDALTGLPNRASILRSIQNTIDREDDNRFALLFLDFDRFKLINDSLGHDVGDDLLKEIANRLQKTVRVTDKILSARLGGDEFVVLLDDLSSDADATGVAERLLQVFSKSYKLGDHTVYSSASIGIVTSVHGYQTACEMLRDADLAMYEAKAAGKSRLAIFDRAMRDEAQVRLRIEGELREAIPRDEFTLVFQPIVSLASGELKAVEALLRWIHPQRGLINPDDFVPIAEETGLIVPIGTWVLDESCRQIALWRRELGENAPSCIHVNVSRRQLLLPNLVKIVKQALERHAIPPECLHLEVTESMIMHDLKTTVATLSELRELGVNIGMDDFGTGHSSLSCLHEFPIDVLKIDRSFIANVKDVQDYSALLQAVLTLADNLSLQVVAEGIEDADQLAVLQTLGCEYGQGFYFAKPFPADQIENYLSQTGVTTPNDSDVSTTDLPASLSADKTTQIYQCDVDA